MEEDFVRMNTKPPAENPQLRTGDVVTRTGLTVRTLHHYEAIGLLTPAGRTPAGHRLCGPAQIRRLQRILALRGLGMRLDDIRTCLRDRRFSLETTLRLQLKRVTDQLRRLQELRARLTDILESLVEGRDVSVEEFLSTMELITMIEKYYTSEQLEELKSRKESLGPEVIKAAEEEWPVLIGKVRATMEGGAAPTAPEVQDLARRWKFLVEQFTGGSPEIAESLARMFRDEPDVASQQGLDPAIFEFIGKAMASLSEVE